MRDRVKLQTRSCGAEGLQERAESVDSSSYNADELTTHINSSHLGPNL